MGKKTTQFFAGPTTSSLLAAGHPDWASSGSPPRTGHSDLSSSGSLLRTGHPTGQTGRQDGSQPPSHHQDSFPKPCSGHWDSQWLPLPRAGNQAGLYQNPGCFSHRSLRNYIFSWIFVGVGSSTSCLPSPLYEFFAWDHPRCLPSFFNCSLQNFSSFSSKSESEHATSEDPDKRVCFLNGLVLNENQNQKGGSCMPCDRKSVLNSSAESKK